MSAQEASCTEGVFTASDGSVLHTVTWRTSVGEGKPRAVIVLVHGYGEHVGRYRELACFLAQEGYVVRAYDARGHGRSPGQRGHVERFAQYVDDLSVFIEALAQTDGGLPRVLLAHSMGGLVALLWIARRAPRVSAAVIVSPLLELRPRHRPLPVWLARVATSRHAPG